MVVFLVELWSRRVGLNHRPTIYETVALPLSYAGSRQERRNKKISNNQQENSRGTAAGDIYTFRHLISSTKG
jgi:hypothetical protein